MNSIDDLIEYLENSIKEVKETLLTSYKEEEEGGENFRASSHEAVLYAYENVLQKLEELKTNLEKANENNT